MSIKTVGVVLRPNDTSIVSSYDRLAKKLKEYNVAIELDTDSAKQIGKTGMAFEEMKQKCDLFISLGGDGTLLGLARQMYNTKKPLLGINAGTLGFLTAAKNDDFENIIDLVFADMHAVEERMMMDVEITTQNGTIKLVALNDVVITKHVFDKMIDIKVSSQNDLITGYYGDGLIISTPTGSTAYNLSAGGPVFFPLAKNFILTPMCPHTLSQRTLVLHYDMEININIPASGAIVIVDGQESFTINPTDTIKITKNEVGAHFVVSKNFNHFKVLREKLHWGRDR